MILVDSDVLIEFRKGAPEAISWIGSLNEPAIPVPGIVAMELLAGARDRQEQARSLRFAQSLEIHWHTTADQVLAYELQERYALGAALSIADLLIAATAIGRGATLFSFNLKHFRIIPSLDVRAPYVR